MRAIADRRSRKHCVDNHCDPRGAPRPQSGPHVGPRPAARSFLHRDARHLEIDTNNRAATQVVFDPDDIDAAFAELDARYLAGEAAAHAHTWSVIARAYAAFNRHELPSTTPDSVNIDHRPAR